MTAGYTDRDLRRAAKEVTAAAQQTYDDMQRLAAAIGKLIGVMDSMGDEPLSGSAFYHDADRLVGEFQDAYNRLADHLRRQS